MRERPRRAHPLLRRRLAHCTPPLPTHSSPSHVILLSEVTCALHRAHCRLTFVCYYHGTAHSPALRRVAPPPRSAVSGHSCGTTRAQHPRQQPRPHVRMTTCARRAIGSNRRVSCLQHITPQPTSPIQLPILYSLCRAWPSPPPPHTHTHSTRPTSRRWLWTPMLQTAPTCSPPTVPAAAAAVARPLCICGTATQCAAQVAPSPPLRRPTRTMRGVRQRQDGWRFRHTVHACTSRHGM